MVGYLIGTWHSSTLVARHEAAAGEERARADRAIDRLITQIASAPPISAEAIDKNERAQRQTDIENHELANMFADEIGSDDEMLVVPPMPERDPRGRRNAGA